MRKTRTTIEREQQRKEIVQGSPEVMEAAERALAKAKAIEARRRLKRVRIDSRTVILAPTDESDEDARAQFIEKSRRRYISGILETKAI